MKTFPTLYKRTKTEAIQQWTISVRPSDSTEDPIPVQVAIIKQVGQLGGKLTEHQEVINAGKNIGKANETTPEQQALLQAESDWKRKHDEGYKSLNDLAIMGYDGKEQYCGPWKGILSLQEALEHQLPQFNTDASGNVKPMLAKDWNGGKNLEYPVYLQPKLDGVRCLMVVQFSNDGVLISFLSRSGKPYITLSHLIPAVEECCESEGVSFILDGEIYSDELSFQMITKAVKKQRPESLKLHFRAYDVVSDSSQTGRLVQTSNLVDNIASPFVTMVHTVIANSAKEVKEFHDKWVKEGYEGAMIRKWDGHYGQGQRSSDLLKVKEFNENEFEFISFEQGQREEDLIAVCHTAEGKEFRAKMIGNKLSKAALQTECDELQGTKLTVKHFGWTDDGLPRFPIGKVFRNYE